MSSHIILLGFMGSGKTTIGRVLAARLGRPFVDLDDHVEAAAGKTVAQIFDDDGEAAFRNLESEALAALLPSACPLLVVALGGGAFLQPRIRETIAQSGAVTVFLDCRLDVMLDRCAGFTHRPLARDPEAFERLHAARLPVYQQAAHVVETSTGTPDEAASAIADAVKRAL